MKRILTLLTAVVFLHVNGQVFDTTGISNWPLLNNSYDTWMQGAFDAHRDSSDPMDFGWGNYDITTHIITGDSIYVLKTIAGNFKAISVDQIASGVYTVTFSDLDGSNKVTKTFDRTPYETKNFFYYSLANDQVKDLEPATSGWDIVFTRYLAFFPGYGAYPVAGALSNRNVETSQVEFNTGSSYSLNDTLQFPFNNTISTIGYDWKTANQSGVIVHDTIMYYVKDQSGNINELKFSGYGGSGNGKMVFSVNGQPDSVSLSVGNVDQVYYSLENKATVATNQDNDWDIAFFAQSSFDAIPVRINDVNGAELYVYPNSDINYWNAVGLKERSVNVLSVYPNPTRHYINIALQADAGKDLRATVLNENGQLIKSQSISPISGISQAKINVNDLSPGVYFLEVSGSGTIATTRILITP